MATIRASWPFGERVFEEIALDYRDSRPFGFANKALARKGARARQQYCVDDKHARQVPTGARLLLVDLWMDVTYTQPPIAPLASGEFLVISGEGQAYGEDEAEAWLTQTGWRKLERRPLAGTGSVIIGEVM